MLTYLSTVATTFANTVYMLKCKWNDLSFLLRVFFPSNLKAQYDITPNKSKANVISFKFIY